jgi:hypothetical protein
MIQLRAGRRMQMRPHDGAALTNANRNREMAEIAETNERTGGRARVYMNKH